MKEVLLLLVMFWNVENYYDPFRDSLTNDAAFTPRGEKFWTWNKFTKKRDDIAKVIMLSKDEYGAFPDLIGLCEVENSFVLYQLVAKTPLARLGYKIIHRDSPDKRGIDVAMLYNPDKFKVLKRRFFPLKIEGDTLPSRLILYAKGLVNGLDTLHCFVNHWPSKLGGEKKSLPMRMIASNTLKEKTDSILRGDSFANIVIMGDFNDAPYSQPLKNMDKFYNMAERFYRKKRPLQGTHKYKERWEVLDQFLVSKQLAPQVIPKGDKEGGKVVVAGKSREGVVGGVEENIGKMMAQKRWLFCEPQGMVIFRDPFMLERDNVFMGDKIKRTLVGPRYNGGVSDHLPVILKIWGFAF